jgi:hypothetical protein
VHVVTEINFLKDYCNLDEFAVDVNRHTRTVCRWINQPDGLPCAWFGNKRIIHVPSAREWLLSRVRQYNPRRRAARKKQVAA